MKLKLQDRPWRILKLLLGMIGIKDFMGSWDKFQCFGLNTSDPVLQKDRLWNSSFFIDFMTGELASLQTHSKVHLSGIY